ncbi:MAG: hypothetical protein RLY31_558 [Bacteroidota bacterium]|jgi:DNA-binding NtrC family response regulator
MSSIQSIKQRFGIIGSSPLLERAIDTAVRVAPTDLTVLIKGESGVGKENISKIIHALSARKHNQFIAVNCGAIPSGTINSELFGHEKGAFTGATGDRKGYFETVDGGTIFLDEIGEMPMDTQAYLLRVLESGEFIRVGSSKVLTTNVRVIAATNVDLEQRMAEGKFREDLYYRLNTVPIMVPALKDRGEDIHLLFRKFSNDIAERYHTDPVRLDDQARYLLEHYRWPGNVRELKNVAEQIAILCEKRLVGAKELVQFVPNVQQRNLPVPSRDGMRAGESLQEREILFKFLFDMKNDLNDLKSLVFELIRQNDLEMPDNSKMQLLKTAMPNFPGWQPTASETASFGEDDASTAVLRKDLPDPIRPIIIERPEKSFDRSEVVDANLNLIEMEKDLILKALKKHVGRRKEAAQDLGISERTLYRKIKEYDLQ